MGLLRVMALGAAAAVAWKLWKDTQTNPVRSRRTPDDDPHITPIHRDPLFDIASFGAEASIPASQSSRGFGSV